MQVSGKILHDQKPTYIYKRRLGMTVVETCNSARHQWNTALVEESFFRSYQNSSLLPQEKRRPERSLRPISQQILYFISEIRKVLSRDKIFMVCGTISSLFILLFYLNFMCCHANI